MVVSNMPTELREILYGKTPIKFSIERKHRNTVAIHVHPDGSVAVSVPVNSETQKIDAVIKKRGRWIQKQRRAFEELYRVPTTKRYVAGESFRYLGRLYRLRLLSSDQTSVRLVGGYLEVGLRDKSDTNLIENLISIWYRQRATVLVAERLALCQKLITHYELPQPTAITIRSMKMRWGSCSKLGRISITPELVFARKECIDYLLLHELCHLAVKNHSAKFFALLSKVCPEWMTFKKWLEASV
jgi:predicted metal-dependent hydrolase